MGLLATDAAAITVPVPASRHIPSQVDGAQLASIIADSGVATTSPARAPAGGAPSRPPAAAAMQTYGLGAWLGVHPS